MPRTKKTTSSTSGNTTAAKPKRSRKKFSELPVTQRFIAISSLLDKTPATKAVAAKQFEAFLSAEELHAYKKQEAALGTITKNAAVSKYLAAVKALEAAIAKYAKQCKTVADNNNFSTKPDATLFDAVISRIAKPTSGGNALGQLRRDWLVKVQKRIAAEVAAS